MSGDLSQTSKPPNHDKPTEMEALVQKTKKFTRGILTCPLKPHETMIAYHQIYLPSVCYSSACTTLSQQQWESIQNPLLYKLLPKLGLPRNFPRELVLGTKHHGGLGLRHSHGEQGTQQMLSLIKHLRLRSSLGTQLNTAMRAHQIQAGLEKPTLEDTEPLRWMDHPWIDRPREFPHHTDAVIELTDAWSQKPQREGDKFLMDAFWADKTLSTQELKHINYCRSHLQVTRSSDITTPDGYHIIPEMLNGEMTIEELNKRRTSTLQWPKQMKPSKEVWKNGNLQFLSTFATTKEHC